MRCDWHEALGLTPPAARPVTCPSAMRSALLQMCRGAMMQMLVILRLRAPAAGSTTCR